MPRVTDSQLFRMPCTLTAGTTVKYRRTLAAYPASEGWTLAAHLAGSSTAHVDATTDGDDFLVTFSTSETTGWKAGAYRFEERVAKAGEVYVTDRQFVTVEPDLAAASDADLQSWAEKTLEVLEASMQAGASADVLRYQVAGRALEHYSLQERMALRNQLRAEIRALKSGGRGLRPVLAYFTGTGLKS